MHDLELLQQFLASVFILFALSLMLLWCLPGNVILKRLEHHFIGRMVVWLGLDTYWGLFAPQPVSKNFLLSFEIELDDKSKVAFRLKQFELGDGYQKIRHYRFIKLHNTLTSQRDDVPRKAICEYVLREFCAADERGKKATAVHMIRFYETDDLYGETILPWLSEVLFTFRITDSKLLGA